MRLEYDNDSVYIIPPLEIFKQKVKKKSRRSGTESPEVKPEVKSETFENGLGREAEQICTNNETEISHPVTSSRLNGFSGSSKLEPEVKKPEVKVEFNGNPRRTSRRTISQNGPGSRSTSPKVEIKPEVTNKTITGSSPNRKINKGRNSSPDESDRPTKRIRKIFLILD